VPRTKKNCANEQLPALHHPARQAGNQGEEEERPVTPQAVVKALRSPAGKTARKALCT